MSGRARGAPARYRPGKAPAEEHDESDSDDAEEIETEEPVEVAPAPAPLPSHSLKPLVTAGVTIQRGDGVIELPRKQEAAAPPEDLDEYGAWSRAVRRLTSRD